MNILALDVGTSSVKAAVLDVATAMPVGPIGASPTRWTRYAGSSRGARGEVMGRGCRRGPLGRAPERSIRQKR